MTEVKTLLCVRPRTLCEITLKVRNTILMGVDLPKFQTSNKSYKECHVLFCHRENGTELKRLLRSTGTCIGFLSSTGQHSKN